MFKLICNYLGALIACYSQGFKGQFGLAKEVTWGTGLIASDFMEIYSEKITQSFDRFDVKNIVGAYYEPDDVAGLQRIAGDIVTMGHPVSIGHFLKAAMNTVSGTTVLSGFLYTTQFISTKSEFADGVPRQPYTLQVYRDVTSAHQYAGMLCDKLSMNIAPNQDLRLTASWLGKAMTLTSSIPAFTPPTSSANPFTFDTASLQIAAAASSRIENYTITVDNQLEGLPALNNSSTIARIRAKGPQMIRVQGTLDFQDVTEQLDFINQTERALILSLVKTASFQLIATLPRVVYTAFPINIPGRQRLTVGFTGTARYHTGSGLAANFQLTSTKSDY